MVTPIHIAIIPMSIVKPVENMLNQYIKVPQKLDMQVEHKIIGLPKRGAYFKKNCLIGQPIIPVSVIARKPKQNMLIVAIVVK